jgi:hypothetical protein
MLDGRMDIIQNVKTEQISRDFICSTLSDTDVGTSTYMIIDVTVILNIVHYPR